MDCRVAYAPRNDKAGGNFLLSDAEEAASLGFHFGYPSAD
jgi:hypothetical protein